MFRVIFSTNQVAEQTSGDLGAHVLPRFTAGHVYFFKLRLVLFNWYFGLCHPPPPLRLRPILN